MSITKGYGLRCPLCLSSFDIFLFLFISSCSAHLHLIQLSPVFRPCTAHRSSPGYSACCVATFGHISLMRELFCLFAPPHTHTPPCGCQLPTIHHSCVVCLLDFIRNKQYELFSQCTNVHLNNKPLETLPSSLFKVLLNDWGKPVFQHMMNKSMF